MVCSTLKGNSFIMKLPVVKTVLTASFSCLYGVNFRVAMNYIKTIEVVEEKEVIPFPGRPQGNTTVPYGAVFDAPFMKITTSNNQTIYAGSSHDIGGFTNTLQSMSNTTATQFT